MKNSTCKDCGIGILHAARTTRRCRDCKAARHREYCARTGYHKKRYARLKAEERERHLIKKYRLTEADFLAMSASQGGVCAICRKPSVRPLNVDHCHQTGKVRGLLCGGCNRMLGYSKDSPDNLKAGALYLEAVMP